MCDVPFGCCTSGTIALISVGRWPLTSKLLLDVKNNLTCFCVFRSVELCTAVTNFFFAIFLPENMIKSVEECFEHVGC